MVNLKREENNIAIYGAGRLGHYIFQYISECAPFIRVKCWIDNTKRSDRENTGLQVFSEEAFIELHIDIPIIVAIDDKIESSRVIVSLLSNGITNIFSIPFRDCAKYRFPVIKNGILNPIWIKPYYTIKPELDYIEYQVVDHCNLRCRSCSHYSNLVNSPIYSSINDYKESIVALAEKFSNISTIRLMGGEPLLHRDLDEFLNVTRHFFPRANIRIVSNGLLVDKMSDCLVDAIKKCWVTLEISQYPITSEKLDSIVCYLEKNDINYSISEPILRFMKTMSCGNEDYRNVWHNYCYIHHKCKFMRNKRLFPCAQAALLYENQEYFDFFIGRDELMDNSLNISGNYSGWDILRRLNEPFTLCRFCSPIRQMVEWKQSKDDMQIEDWIV